MLMLKESIFLKLDNRDLDRINNDLSRSIKKRLPQETNKNEIAYLQFHFMLTIS